MPCIDLELVAGRPLTTLPADFCPLSQSVSGSGDRIVDIKFECCGIHLTDIVLTAMEDGIRNAAAKSRSPRMLIPGDVALVLPRGKAMTGTQPTGKFSGKLDALLTIHGTGQFEDK